MDYSWFIDTDHFGTPEVWPADCIRIVRTFWEHSCLDIDIDHATATHRDQSQPHAADPDPDRWNGAVRPLRHHGSFWEILCTEGDVASWVRQHEERLVNAQTLAAKYPHLSRAADIEGRKRDLEAVRALRAGWLALASDIAAAIDGMLPKGWSGPQGG
jgi:hypothetical protein